MEVNQPMSEHDTTAAKVTDRDVTELEHSALRAEYEEAQERIWWHQPEDPEEVDRLHSRMSDLWDELESRADVEQPECPECGSRSWGQVPGGPTRCGGCDLHLGMEHEDLSTEVGKAWERILAGPEAETDE